MPAADATPEPTHDSQARFASTHWSVVLAAAQTASPEAQSALEKLCRSYWYPLYAYLRRKGHKPPEAEDLTQEFFSSRVITKRIFEGLQPGAGLALEDGAHPVEQAVYNRVASYNGASFKEVREHVKGVIEPIVNRLQKSDLLLSDPAAQTARWIPLLLALTVPLAGLVKTYIGLMRDKPITWLTLLCGLSLVVALLLFGRLPHRTRRADNALAKLKQKYSELQQYPLGVTGSAASTLLPLAVGLFGVGILEEIGQAQLRKWLGPENGADCGSFDSSGASCGGGSCGGGGCGGCGGGD